MAKITVVADQRIGRYVKGDKIRIDKYAGRALVAMGKAKFDTDTDEFRRPTTTPRKRSRRTYQRRDLVAIPPTSSSTS